MFMRAMFTKITKLLFLFLFVAIAGAALRAQDQAPVILHEAAHCLVTDSHNWLDAETLQASELSLGYQLDTKTLLGDEYLYVIVYTNPRRNEGKIFDIRIKQKHVYSVENSARFIGTDKGVQLPDPPAGGQWALTQLLSAIENIERHK